MTPPLRRATAVSTVAAALALAATAVPAHAAKLFTLDKTPAGPANVVRDLTDTAYFAWPHEAGGTAPDRAQFCKVVRGGRSCKSPITLPIPLAYGESSLDASDSITGAFPILGPGSTVYIVAPRYERNDVILYTSTNGGHSFGAGAVIAHKTPPEDGPYSNKTDPTEAFRVGSNFYIGAFNTGLGFSSFGADTGNFTFSDPGPGGVGGGSLALAPGGFPVEAYWNLSDPRSTIHFYRYTGPGPVTSQAAWSGPTPVATGYGVRLAGGAGGVFMASYEYPTATTKSANALRVRKLSGGSFARKATLAVDKRTNLFAAGAIAQAPGGGVAVVWPGYRAGDGKYVMRLWSSKNGDTFRKPVQVARIGNGYDINDNAKMTIGDDGLGWLTFLDDAGVHGADFTPIKPYIPPPYKGPTKSVSKSVARGVKVKVKAPKRCVASGQKFPISVRTKVKRKHAHGLKAKLKRVGITADEAKVATIKKKPFRRHIRITGLPGSKHTVVVSATLQLKRPHRKAKTVKRRVKVKLRLC